MGLCEKCACIHITWMSTLAVQWGHEKDRFLFTAFPFKYTTEKLKQMCLRATFFSPNYSEERKFPFLYLCLSKCKLAKTYSQNIKICIFFLHFLQDKRPKLDFFPLGRGIWWCPSLLVRNSMDRPGVLYTGPGDWAGHWEAELQRWPRGRVGAVTHDLLFNRDVLMAVAWLTFPHQSYHRGGCLLFFSKRIKFSNIL